MLDQKILDEIKERCQKTTPAPWTSLIEDRDFQSGASFIQTGGEDIYLSGASTDDYDFIAHARQDIPLLLQEIERLQNLCSTWNIPEHAMSISELFENYYFHDSSFLNMEYSPESKLLKLYCQFCDFMQKDYRDCEPTNSEILILFRNASFSGEFFQESEILTQKLTDNHTICFFLADETHSDFSEFSVSADDVQIQVIRKYCL